MSDAKAVQVTAAQAAAFRLARQHLAGVRPAHAFAPPPAGARSRSAKGAADNPGAKVSGERSVVDVVRDSGGIQAQVQSAAELSIWTRRRETTRADIRRALWDTREIVKTSALRMTLHLIPARDLAVYVAATRPSARAKLALWQRRLKITSEDVRRLIDTLLDSLGDGALTQQELVAQAKQRAHKGMRAWLEHAWIPVRPAVIEGAIVYGPPRGAEATFVRADRWLGPQAVVAVDAARAELLKRFLRAFGPATAHDFAKWSGIKVTEARTMVDALAHELTEVSVGGASGWIASDDVETLRRSALDSGAVRLLGPFDSLLLAHAAKEHLVDAAFYKRVYRPQGWISAVVLRGTTIVGTWTQKNEGRTIALDIDLFGRPSAAIRRALEEEAEAISAFLGKRCIPRFS